MKKILLLSGLMIFGCSDPLTQTCEEAEMPIVSETIPEDQIALPTKSVLLLDYSGSMHAIYPEKRSSVSPSEPYFFENAAFADVLALWLDTSSPSGQANQFEIVLFNDLPYNFNPQTKKISKFASLTHSLNLGDASKEDIKTWIQATPSNPYKTAAKPIAPNGGLTQIKGALQSVVDATTEDVVIWLLTDNVSDQAATGTSEAEASSNKEFYDYLKAEPSIKAVLGYPLKDASVFKGRSLMLYGIYHSKNDVTSQQIRHVMGEGTSASAVKGMLWNPDLGAKSKAYSCNPASNQGKAIRLKPIDSDVLSVSLQQPVCPSNVTMESLKVSCTAIVNIENNLNHQVVTKANVSLSQQTLHPKVEGENPEWIGDICANTLSVDKVDGKSITNSQIEITDLKPKESRAVKIRFSMENPPVSTSSLSEILAVAQTAKVDFDGELYVTVDGIETSLDIDKSELSCIAKSDDVPDLFKAQTQSKPSTVEEEFSFKLKNSGNEQAMLLLLLFGGLGGLGLLGVMRFQGVGLEMLIDGRMHPEGPFNLVRISRKQFGKQKGDTPFVQISRGWGKAYKVSGVNGYIVEPDEHDLSVYVAYPMDDESDRMKVLIRRAFSGGDSFDSSDADF